MKKAYGICIFLLLLCIQCAKKSSDPCMAEWYCKDCNCLFDKLQQNLNDPETAKKIQECYDRVCK